MAAATQNHDKAEAPRGPIPHYYLYGAQDADSDQDLLHSEPIRDRSGPHDWRIRPHAHPDHLQILLVQQGGGVIWIEGRAQPITAPALLLIPAGIVHQIDFAAATDGFVVTAALAFLRQAMAGDSRLEPLSRQPLVAGLAGSGLDGGAVLDTFRWLHHEFIWSAPGRRLAILAQFMRILVIALRLSITQAQAAPGAFDRDYDLVIRYRALLEQNFRTRRALSWYADALAVTPARLNAACRARADSTASGLLHGRILIEAKRYLLYSESSVAQVAHLTGFDDPAYFNRFFAQRMGQAPGAFRAAQRQAGPRQP